MLLSYEIICKSEGWNSSYKRVLFFIASNERLKKWNLTIQLSHHFLHIMVSNQIAAVLIIMQIHFGALSGTCLQILFDSWFARTKHNLLLFGITAEHIAFKMK